MSEENRRYNRAFAVTKSDTVNFEAGICDALHVGGAGIVVAVMEDNSTCALTCVAGELLPLRMKRVNSTTTSATVMSALYLE
jgi:hypothetical protein